MTVKRINLALQGGGAHGAFTWGVLDCLLDEDRIEIAAISGTSAGALNGAAVKAGLASGNSKTARENLDWLWSQIGAIRSDAFADFLSFWSPPAALVSRALEYAPGYQIAENASRMLSPYAYGPIYQNPLADLVNDMHFDAICSKKGPEFCICATNVRTGKIKVFHEDEISPHAILASACLPTMFQAIEIGDQAYWDGGYTGNPALFPLFEQSLPNDIVIVNINPLTRLEIPKTPQEIQNRINEISFNSSLFRELRAIAFVKRLIAEDKVANNTMKDVYVHMIADDELMRQLSVATKLVPTPSVMADLKRAGQAAAQSFLDQHFDKLNVEGSVNLEEMFG